MILGSLLGPATLAHQEEQLKQLQAALVQLEEREAAWKAQEKVWLASIERHLRHRSNQV